MKAKIRHTEKGYIKNDMPKPDDQSLTSTKVTTDEKFKDKPGTMGNGSEPTVTTEYRI